jgi:hypothetical protein
LMRGLFYLRFGENRSLIRFKALLAICFACEIEKA